MSPRSIVFLVLTREGWVNLLDSRAIDNSLAVWLNAGILAPDELTSLRADGRELTNFSRLIEVSDLSAIAGALDTVREHHPNASIWLESIARDA